MKRRVLVTGAAGYIAGKVIERLCGKPWVEKVVGTDIREPARYPPGFVFERRDIRQSMTDIFEKEAIDTVVHTAYILPPIHNKAEMEDVNKGGTRNILAAAAAAEVEQVVYTSSTTAYGFHADNAVPLTEKSPLRGNDDITYAKNKKEIEAIFSTFRAQHPEIAVSILRPCYVIGPNIANPLSTHLKKRFVVLPAKSRPWQFVHEDDVAGVMVRLIENQVGGIYNVAGAGTLGFSEMVKMLGNTAVYLPWPLLYCVNNLAWHLRLSAVTEFPSPMMQMMVHPWIASSEKLVAETGYRFRHDTRSAFEDFARSVISTNHRRQ
ncbi:MAG: NAD-dependent epimerase/dehydratase family protein [Thermodesulfobacteriota bacterium]